MIRPTLTFAALILLFSASPRLLAQPSGQPTPATPLAFDLADVHPSAHSKAQYMSGAPPHAGRFRVHNATIINLVSIAYSIDDRNILGGPSWLDTDRFDVIASAPATTSDDDLKLMLRGMLADRFKLVLHNDTKPLAAVVMTAAKGGPRLNPSSAPGASGCKTPPQPSSAAPSAPNATGTFSCHGETMAAFVQFLQQQVLWQIYQPIIDSTGLKGAWDFDFKAVYPSRNAEDCAAIVNAIDSQLGLKLTPGASPMPILVIDSANETPTPNPPGIATVQTAPPPTDFDVATIKPTGPDNKGLMGRINRDQIDVTGITLLKLINFAWDFDAPMIANPPKWLDEDKFDVLAKVAAPDPSAGPASDLDTEDFQKMTRKLIEERFNFKWHMEDRPTDAYVLLAVNPRLKKADPLYRSGCKEGPGPDGKDPRIATPILGRLISCQNATMAQFVDFLFQRNNGYIKTALFDGTGLTGNYDFVLSFSGYSQVGGINEYSLPAAPTGESGSGSSGTAADPNGAIPLFDAIKQQLGLKIEKQKRSIPMLVIDHIDEKPTEN